MINAIYQVFPKTRIRERFFYFYQSKKMKIQNEGLYHRYNTDLEFWKNVKMLSALAYDPINLIVESFDFLAENVPLDAELEGVINYFEDTSIGRPFRNRFRCAPRFRHELWNCYEDAGESSRKPTIQWKTGILRLKSKFLPVIQASGILSRASSESTSHRRWKYTQ